MAEEELCVLAEIFCFPGELIHWRSGDLIHINVNISEPCTRLGSSHDVLLGFVLPPDYPLSGISEINVISSSLPTQLINQTKEKMQRRGVNCAGEPMLLELIEVAKESVKSLHDLADACELLYNQSNKEKNKSLKPGGGIQPGEGIQPGKDPGTTENKPINCSSAKQEDLWLTLIQLDHMRSKSKYTKIIKNWCKNFNLSGRLIFCQKLILILLLGDRENLKSYLVQHKTACVDVDSRGHSCKERMMSILTEQPFPHTNETKNRRRISSLCPAPGMNYFKRWPRNQAQMATNMTQESRFSDFQILECSSMTEVENLFKAVQLLPLYKDHVMK